jgi:hypothetical protein
MSSATPSIEARLREIEDRLEIYTLIAAHPPSADTGAAFCTSYIYFEDGKFDRGEGLPGAVGNEAIGALVRTEEHQAAINGGLRFARREPSTLVRGGAALQSDDQCRYLRKRDTAHTAGVDVDRSLRIATVNAAVGGKTIIHISAELGCAEPRPVSPSGKG